MASTGYAGCSACPNAIPRCADCPYETSDSLMDMLDMRETDPEKFARLYPFAVTPEAEERRWWHIFTKELW